MKTKFFMLILVLMVATVARPDTFDTFEFATIRWAGKENTYVIRPSGKAETFRQVFQKVSRPNFADERSFYLNVAMNAMGKEGYEFAGMTNDEIVMKRRRQQNP